VRGNTYDFIILTLIHIHRAATYVSLFIGPCVWCSPRRRGECAKRHAMTPQLVAALITSHVTPRSREAISSEKDRFRVLVRNNHFVARGAVFLLFHVRQTTGCAIYIHSWSSKQLIWAKHWTLWKIPRYRDLAFFASTHFIWCMFIILARDDRDA